MQKKIIFKKKPNNLMQINKIKKFYNNFKINFSHKIKKISIHSSSYSEIII